MDARVICNGWRHTPIRFAKTSSGRIEHANTPSHSAVNVVCVSGYPLLTYADVRAPCMVPPMVVIVWAVLTRVAPFVFVCVPSPYAYADATCVWGEREDGYAHVLLP